MSANKPLERPERPRNRRLNLGSLRIFSAALNDIKPDRNRSQSSVQNTLAHTRIENSRTLNEENEIKSAENTEFSLVTSGHAKSATSLNSHNEICVTSSGNRTNKDSHVYGSDNLSLNCESRDKVSNFASSRNVISCCNQNNTINSPSAELSQNNPYNSSGTVEQVCVLNVASLFDPAVEHTARSIGKKYEVQTNITHSRTNDCVKNEFSSTNKKFNSNKLNNSDFEIKSCSRLKNDLHIYDLPEAAFNGEYSTYSSSSAVHSTVHNKENDFCHTGSGSSWESYSSSGTNSDTWACSAHTNQEGSGVNNDSNLIDADCFEGKNGSIIPEQIAAISEFLLSIENDRTVCNNTAYKVQRDLNRVFYKFFKGDTVDIYGSYQSGLAISTSNINLVIKSDTSLKSSFMSEVHKVLLKELHGYQNFRYEDATSAKNTKISFFEPYTSVACELVYLGRSRIDFCKLAVLLKNLCHLDRRIKTLIVAAKVWAEVCDMCETKDGKLPSIAFALMVVHFLQHREKPLLSIIDTSSDLEKLRTFSGIDSSVGELWLQFLKYYTSVFNWTEHTVNITSKQPVLKSSRPSKHCWIDIEDPFTKKNVAESVKTFTKALNIQACFKSCYHYFLYPGDNSDLDTEIRSDEKTVKRWHFSFDSCNVLQKMPEACEECEDLGSTCEDCVRKLFEPLSLSKMSNDSLEIVSETLYKVYDEYILPDEEIEKRRSFVRYLQKYIRQRFYDAKLTLFGSSVNGFGFKHSDLDICLSFKDKTESDINKCEILKSLCYHLRKHKNLANVFFLLSAKIPILKLHHPPSGYRCDISLFNTLAVHNSELLWTYSLIDVRCRVIACALKLLAKKACICDTVNKKLSSYSYILMAIHFLQQTDPPILPVLQNPATFSTSFSEPAIYVDDCNVWFYKDMEGIKNVYGQKNKQSVGELWLELLHYYGNFNFEHVITIRQTDPLKLQDKKNSAETFMAARLFDIEDPFITTKNLGCSVSAEGGLEIQFVFRRALQLFGTPLPYRPYGITDFKNHFFAPANLTRRFIRDIECTLCGKVGHEKDNCNEIYHPKKRFVSRKPVVYGQFLNKNVLPRRS